jgi:hypothetical protein
VVAGDHLDADARLAALAHRRDRLVARRVDDAGQSEQPKAAVDVGELEAFL